jgi:hypothetical protein
MMSNFNSWIDPQGKVISVPMAGHNDYATKHLKEGLQCNLIDLLEEEGVDYPYQLLHKRGWIRCMDHQGKISIMGDCIDLTKPMRNTMDPPMNAAQMRTAKRLASENGTTIHKLINPKMFW